MTRDDQSTRAVVTFARSPEILDLVRRFEALRAGDARAARARVTDELAAGTFGGTPWYFSIERLDWGALCRDGSAHWVDDDPREQACAHCGEIHPCR